MTVSISELQASLAELRQYRNHELAVLYRTAQTVRAEARQFINSAKMAEKAMEKKQEAIDLIKAVKTE